MPSLAVLATWALMTLWFLALGAPALALTARRLGWLGALRVGLWCGLATSILLVLCINFVVPLRSTSAVATAAIVTVLALGLGAVLYARARASTVDNDGSDTTARFAWWSVPVIVTLALGLVALAHSTFGLVGQWDAGLYHINAIQYASEFRVVPGLANLHDRLGVTNSPHLITALMSNTGWGLEALRLQVGLFIVLLVVDFSLRLVQLRTSDARTPTAGTVLLALGLVGMWPFLLSNPPEVTTSPIPDTAALIVMIVGGAYLLDAMVTRRVDWAGTAIVIVATAASIRTQLWAFAVLAVLVLVVSFRRTPATHAPNRTMVVVAATLSVGLLLATQLRDAILSGWLLFPLSYFPLPVDWKAFDPEASRIWIVSWARTPGASPEQTLGNWDWVGGWITRSATDWGIQLAIGLAALALVLWLFRRSEKHDGATRTTAGLWLMIPIVTSVVLWFVSAPDPRFAWGPIVLLGAVPAAMAMTWALGTRSVPVAAAFAVLAALPATLLALTTIDGYQGEREQVVTFTGVPWTIAPAIVPIETATLVTYTLPTGQELLTPTTDDRCFTTFPLCRPYPNDTLLFRGESVQDGFASSRWNQPGP